MGGKLSIYLGIWVLVGVVVERSIFQTTKLGLLDDIICLMWRFSGVYYELKLSKQKMHWL